MAAYSGRHGKRRSRTGGASWRGVRLAGMADGRSQAGSEWLRARARHWVSRRGKMQGERAERVIRPARERGSWWSRFADPGRCGLSSGPGCGPSPVPPARRLAAKRPEGRWFSPTPYLSIALDLGVAAVVSLQFHDEAVIAVGGEEASWEPGAGFRVGGRGCRWSRPHRRRIQ